MTPKRMIRQKTQVVNYDRDHEYQVLQEAILDKAKVHCTVVVTPDHVSIKPNSGIYADYLLAKNAIKAKVGDKPIVMFQETR